MVTPSLLKTLQELNLIQPGQSYPIWSPYDATAAGEAMLKFLKEHANL